MTRGTFYLITNDKIYSSVEFNGDMYPDGHGLIAKKMLEEVTNLGEFMEMVKKFNVEEDFNYDTDEYKGLNFVGDLVVEHPVSVLNKYTDFNYEYFTLSNEFYWFSDWLFIKNISNKEWEFTYTDKKEYYSDELPSTTIKGGKTLVKSGKILISNYGRKPSEANMAILEERSEKDIEYARSKNEIIEQIKAGKKSGNVGKIGWEIDFWLEEVE